MFYHFDICTLVQKCIEFEFTPRVQFRVSRVLSTLGFFVSLKFTKLDILWTFPMTFKVLLILAYYYPYALIPGLVILP